MILSYYVWLCTVQLENHTQQRFANTNTARASRGTPSSSHAAKCASVEAGGPCPRVEPGRAHPAAPVTVCPCAFKQRDCEGPRCLTSRVLGTGTTPAVSCAVWLCSWGESHALYGLDTASGLDTATWSCPGRMHERGSGRCCSVVGWGHRGESAHAASTIPIEREGRTYTEYSVEQRLGGPAARSSFFFFFLKINTRRFTR